MADTYNPRITQGETWPLVVTVTGVNLSGYTVRCKGRADFASTGTIWDKSTTGGTITVSAGANSTVTMTLSATETAALTRWTVGVFDMEYETGGVVTNILRGVFNVYPEVTRA